jgi:endoglucanase
MKTFITSSTRLCAALTLLASCWGLAAHSQTPLDSAPGAPTATLTNSPAATPPPPAPALLPPVESGPSLLSNSDFSLATKKADWPDGWGKGAGISWETENGTHFLRLVQQTPGKMLMAYREMPLPEDVKGVSITIRFRTLGVVHGKSNWMDARSIFHWLDDKRKPVKGDPPAIVFGTKAPTWTEKTVSAAVPEGAKTLVLIPSLFMANAGTLDLAEVRVTSIDQAAVDALNAAAAAKTKMAADRAAIVAQQVALPPKTTELKVSGNQLVTPDGKTVWLQGVNVIPLAWSPNGEGSVPYSIYIATHDWHANVIRLPVMNSLWFGKGRGDVTSNDAEAYRAIADQAIKVAAANGAYVVLDLHRFLTPDQSCIDFWKDAAARYKNNPAVLFDLFNEPHDTSWDVWQKGGPVQTKGKDGAPTTVQGVGMQALIDTVRATGAHNIVVCGGLEYAYDLTGVMKGFALDNKGGYGIMYATHFYNWHKEWSKHFMDVAAKYPVLIGETGATDAPMSFIPAKDWEAPNTWSPDLIAFIQKNHLNWTGWSFYGHGGGPGMLLDMDNFTPNAFWGQYVKDALNGKQFTMQKER